MENKLYLKKISSYYLIYNVISSDSYYISYKHFLLLLILFFSTSQIAEQPFEYPLTSSNEEISSNSILSNNSSVKHNLLSTAMVDPGLPVGTITGTLRAANGSSAYTIPLKLPDGTNGLMPSLALVYNSNNPNGQLGLGWTLSGISTISRTGKSLYLDDKVEGITFTSSDRFALDGSQLILENGSYGASGSSYRTEVESFSRITAQGNEGNGPAWFKVEMKNGLIYEYGKPETSRIRDANSSTILLWKINQIYDRYGNYMKFEYEITGGEQLLKKIRYTGNSVTNLSPYNRIDFHYKDRSDGGRSDNNTTYVEGTGIRMAHLLDEIQVYTNDNNSIYRKYVIDYKKQFIYSLLESITEYGQNDMYFNSTRFEYGSNDLDGFEDDLLNINGEPSGKWRDLQAVDVNGDGYDDIISTLWYEENDAKFQESYKILINQKDGTYFNNWTEQFDTDNKYEVFRNKKYPNTILNTTGDFNGDGYGDLLTSQMVYENGYYQVKNIEIGYGNDSGIFGSTATFPTDIDFRAINYNHGSRIFPGDFDGDGRTDYISVFSNRTGYRTFFSSPGLNEINQLVSVEGSLNSNYQNADIPSADQVLPLDFNGDGKLDLMVVKGNTSKIYTLEEGTGSYDYHFKKIYDAGFPTKYHQIHLGDFNGDGKTDLFTRTDDGTRRVATSTGISFNERVFNFRDSFNYDSNDKKDLDWLYVSDFNGDGKSDIIHGWKQPTGSSHNTRLAAYFGSGDFADGDNFRAWDFNANSELTKDLVPGFDGPTPWTLGDFNGDGKVDILNRSSRFPHQNIFHFRIGNENLLTKITDGYGRDYELVYKKMNQDANLYQKGAAVSYPLIQMNHPMYLLSSTSMPDGIGGINTTEYRYERALAHKAGRGMLGFEKQVTLNNSLDLKTTETFELNETYYRNLLKTKRVETMQSSSGISQTDYMYQFKDYGNKRHWDFIYSQITQDLIRSRTTTETFASYDNDGNLEEYASETDYGESVEINYQYTQAGSWLNNVPSYKTVRSTRGTDSFEKITHYLYWTLGKLKDQYEFNGTPGQVWTHYEYESNGNLKSEEVDGLFLPARKTSHAYDTKGRYITEVTDPIGQKSFTSYHSIWGKPITETDIEGNITSYLYNDMGQLETTTSPIGTTIEITREWDLQSGTGTDPINVQNALYHVTETFSDGPNKRTYFDILGRERKIETQHFDGTWLQGVTTYDQKGRVHKTTTPFLISVVPVVTTMEYDEFNRLKKEFNTWATTSYQYQVLNYGQLSTTRTNPDGEITTTITDAADRPIAAIHGGNTLTYSYDALGQQTKVMSGTDKISEAIFDGYGRQESLFDPNAGLTTYKYDAYGQLEYQEDARGKRITYTYDLLGRTRTEVSEEGQTTYDYVLSGNGIGQLDKVTHYSGTIEDYDYDQYGRETSMIKTIDGTLFPTATTYDIEGKIESITYPSGIKIWYEYNTYGFHHKILNEDKTKTLWELLETNEFGQHKEFKTVNGISSKHYYTNFGHPSKFYAGGGIQDLRFKFNKKNGNLDEREDVIKGFKETFSYDNINRLTGATIQNGLTHSYSYNANGNILTKSDVAAGTFEYDQDKFNSLTRVSSPNLTGIVWDEKDLTYDTFQQPTVIGYGDNKYKVSLIYGPGEHRVKLTQEAAGFLNRTIYYVGNYEKLIHNNDTYEIHYIGAGEGIVGMIVKENGVDQFYSVYTDHLGSILTVTDENAAIIGELNFDAWGRYRDPSTWSYNFSSLSQKWLYRGFTGHEHIGAFNLINMNGRLYDPIVGRMLSPDNYVQIPFSLQGFNRCSYAFNNPLKYTDPSGELVPVLAVSALIGAALGGTINLAAHAHQIKSFKDGAIAFGIGAIAGAAAGVTGGASFTALGGTAIAGGGGFLAGSVSSFAGSTVGATIENLGNFWYFGDPLKRIDQLLVDGAIGALTAGTLNGALAKVNGLTFWTGKSINGLLTPHYPLINPNTVKNPVETKAKLEVDPTAIKQVPLNNSARQAGVAKNLDDNSTVFNFGDGRTMTIKAASGAAKGSIQLTKARFGHTFVKHGEDAGTFLINRAKGSGQVQGQFLNNQKAAQFILDNVGKTANGAVNVPIPKGFPARVIMPNGTFRNATHIRLVPGGNGVKTAYPLIPGL